MYGCESWTVSAKELMLLSINCWRRPLRVPWIARRSNQSISPECSLEGMMLKLKLQYFGHLMQRVDPLEKSLAPALIAGRWGGPLAQFWSDIKVLLHILILMCMTVIQNIQFLRAL